MVCLLVYVLLVQCFSKCVTPGRLWFQELEMRNLDLERRVQDSEQTLASALEDRERAENEVQRVVQILDVKIFDLNDLRQSLVKLISK